MKIKSLIWKKCQYCGNYISWVKTAKGKWMPVEQKRVVITPELCRNSKQKPYTIIDCNGYVYTGGEIQRPDENDYVRVGRVVHWGRCARDRRVPRPNKEGEKFMNVSRLLTKAALADNIESIRRLIRQGQDVHAGDDEALYVAVYMGNTSATRALLLAGAEPTARDYGNILLAAKNRRDQIGALLSRYMHTRQREEAVDKLEEEGINVYVIRQYGLLPRIETEQQSLLNQLMIGG